MNVKLTRQAWNLIGRGTSTHQGRGNLATISNDLTSQFSVKVVKNGSFIGFIKPGHSRTLATTPGDKLEVVSGFDSFHCSCATGQVLS